MSRVGLTLCCLLSLLHCTVSLDLSQIEVYPENGRIAGVFMAMLKAYSFNYTTATEVCRFLSARIATKAEVELALRGGLERCRFGWIEEKLAVVLRITPNEKCGKSKVGLVTWAVPTNRSFDVFCFNSTGHTEAKTSSTPTNAVNRSPQANVTSLSSTQSTASNKNFPSLSSSVPSTSSTFSTSVSSTFFPSAVNSVSATRSPPSLSPSSAQYPLATSSSNSTASLSSISLSTHLLTYTSSLSSPSNQTRPLEQDTPTSSFGEVATACVIIAVMLLLMAVAGAVWYFKIKQTHRFPPWVRIRHKDMFETEMWKHTEQNSFSDEITLQLEEETE